MATRRPFSVGLHVQKTLNARSSSHLFRMSTRSLREGLCYVPDATRRSLCKAALELAVHHAMLDVDNLVFLILQNSLFMTSIRSHDQYLSCESLPLSISFYCRGLLSNSRQTILHLGPPPPQRLTFQTGLLIATLLVGCLCTNKFFANCFSVQRSAVPLMEGNIFNSKLVILLQNCKNCNPSYAAESCRVADQRDIIFWLFFPWIVCILYFIGANLFPPIGRPCNACASFPKY